MRGVVGGARCRRIGGYIMIPSALLEAKGSSQSWRMLAKVYGKLNKVAYISIAVPVLGATTFRNGACCTALCVAHVAPLSVWLVCVLASVPASLLFCPKICQAYHKTMQQSQNLCLRLGARGILQYV